MRVDGPVANSITQADVFLEARSSHELERNALVSVFLRVLEYHSGGMFTIAYLRYFSYFS
jgi:hypothetical protein